MKNPAPVTSLTGRPRPAPPQRLCARCKSRPRHPGQKWCRICKSSHQRARRALLRAWRHALATQATPQGEMIIPAPGALPPLRPRATLSEEPPQFRKLDHAAWTLLNALPPAVRLAIWRTAHEYRLPAWLVMAGAVARAVGRQGNL